MFFSPIERIAYNIILLLHNINTHRHNYTLHRNLFWEHNTSFLGLLLSENKAELAVEEKLLSNWKLFH